MRRHDEAGAFKITDRKTDMIIASGLTAFPNEVDDVASKRAAAATAAPYRPRRFVLRDGREVTMRAIRVEDEAALVRAFERLSPRSRYLRFMQHKREIDLSVLARGLRPEPGREFALVAAAPAGSGYDIVGAARYVQGDDPAACEFAVTVADEWTGQGLATTLMRSLMHRARSDGYLRIEGVVLPHNDAMLALARHLRFKVLPQPADRTLVLVRKQLAGAAPAVAAARRR